MNYSEQDYMQAKRKLRLLSVSVMILTLVTGFAALFCFPPKIVPAILLICFVGLTYFVVKMTDNALADVTKLIGG